MKFRIYRTEYASGHSLFQVARRLWGFWVLIKGYDGFENGSFRTGPKTFFSEELAKDFCRQYARKHLTGTVVSKTHTDFFTA